MSRSYFQFSVRSWFIATSVLIVVFFAVTKYWTKPYAITASYPNGQLAYEQWERRTLNGQIEHIKTLWWFPNGNRAFQGASGTAVYWGLNGERFDGTDREAVTEWSRKYGHLIRNTSEPSVRPHKDLLYWWNEW